MDAEEVLKFWFVECTPQQWFEKNTVLDQKIKERFGTVLGQAIKGELTHWRATPRGRLAEIIVLDQFSRNIYRDTPQAFVGDTQALEGTREAIAAGDDMRLTEVERQFVYMPYMHSESPEVHTEGLALFEKLGNASVLKYERLHKDIIDRFGRYPHRNAILGRVSTPEELEFLKTNPGF